MAVTIQKIADHCGVSRGTVDRVLNKRGKVAPEVEERVLKIAAQLDYIQRPRKKRCNFTIGVITQLSKASFMQEIKKGLQHAKEDLEHRNVTVLIKESTSICEEEQLRFMNELEAEGMQALAIMPVDSDKIRSRINQLIDVHNLPVITFNSDILGTRRISFIGLDNKQSGIAAAGLMGTYLHGEGKVLIINGYFTNRTNSLRIDGFIEEMRNTYPKIHLLGVQSSQDQSSIVEAIVLQTFQNHPDLKGIFLASAGHQGVACAIKKSGRKQRPFLIAYDITSQNIDSLKRGDFDFLIDQENRRQGYLPPMLLYNILAKNQYPQEYVYTDIQLKTKHTI